eukprot:428922_1
MKASVKESDLDKADELMEDINEAMDQVNEMNEAMHQPLGQMLEDDELETELAELEELEADELLNDMSAGQSYKYAMSGERDAMLMRQSVRTKQLYQEINATKEYQETYWFGIKYESYTGELIPVNKFWCDFAMYLLNGDMKDKDSKLEFLSKWFLLCTGSIHEIICCLAVLDLRFESNGPMYQYLNVDDDAKMPLKLVTDGGCIVFNKQIDVEDAKDDGSVQSSISVNVSYFDPCDLYEYGDDGEKYDKFIIPDNDCFYTLKVYCCLIVLTNVSSMEQNLKMLVEIPSGAVPCGKNSYFNKTHFITIQSYTTEKLLFYFYFPERKGNDKFYSFPIIVSKNRNNKIVSWTKAQKLNVISSINKENIENNNEYVQSKDVSMIQFTNDDINTTNEQCKVLAQIVVHKLHITEELAADFVIDEKEVEKMEAEVLAKLKPKQKELNEKQQQLDLIGTDLELVEDEILMLEEDEDTDEDTDDDNSDEDDDEKEDIKQQKKELKKKKKK